MKALLSVLLFALAISVTGCGSGGNTVVEPAEPELSATEEMMESDEYDKAMSELGS